MFQSIKRMLKKLQNTGFFHIFGSSSLNKIVAFASVFILVRIIPKPEYGIFSYANNILSFFLIAAGLGAPFGVLQLCSEKKDETDRIKIYNFGCRVSTLSNIVLAGIILLVSFTVPLKIEGSNSCLVLMAFLPLVTLLYEMQCMYLRTALRNREYAYSNTVATVLICVFSCGFSLLFSVNGLIAGKYIASLLAFLFILIRYKVPYNISKVDISNTDKDAFWHISLISMLNNGLSRLMFLIDIFVLGLFIPSSVEIASYKVATNIPTALSFIPGAVITYIYPYFAQNKDNKQWVLNNYLKLTGVFLVGSTIISLMLFAFAPFFISLFFGKTYLDCVPAFRVLSISFVFSTTFRTLPGNLLVTQRKLNFNLCVAVFSSAINTVLNVFLIKHMGAVGAAYATLLTVIITGILNVSYFLYILKRKNVKTV